MPTLTRLQSEEALTEIYLKQYSQFKETSSILDSNLPRISTIYKGFCIDIINKTALTNENINFVKVGELIKSAPSKVTSNDKSKRLMMFNLGRLEEMTNTMLNLAFSLKHIRIYWIRY